MTTMRPDVLLHECVEAFDVDILIDALNFEQPGLYSVHTFVFDTVQQGIPISRKRRYSLAVRNATMQRVRKVSIADFSSLTFCPVELSAKVFFISSEEEQERIRKAMTKAANLPEDCQGKRWHWRALLSPGDHARLQEALAGGFLSDAGSGLLSLSQTAGFQRRNADVAPTLLKSSNLYIAVGKGLKSDRPLMPSEYYAMQLVPVGLPAGHISAKFFSEDDLWAAGILATCLQARTFTGNAMNVGAVGSCLLYGLGSHISSGFR